MDFIEALKLAVNVIRDTRDGLDKIYLYELNSQTQITLSNCDASVEFSYDEPLAEQIYLASFLDSKNLKTKFLTLEVIFSTKWEVRLQKKQHLKATRALLGKTAEVFIDYTPVGKEEVENV